MSILTHATVFDGHSAELQKDQTVVVNGGRIASVSASPPPVGAPVIDCGGRTLMPGLIDAHIHAYAADVNLLKNDRELPDGGVRPVAPDSDGGREVIAYLEKCQTTQKLNGCIEGGGPDIGGCASLRVVPLA